MLSPLLLDSRKSSSLFRLQFGTELLLLLLQDLLVSQLEIHRMIGLSSLRAERIGDAKIVGATDNQAVTME